MIMMGNPFVKYGLIMGSFYNNCPYTVITKFEEGNPQHLFGNCHGRCHKVRFDKEEFTFLIYFTTRIINSLPDPVLKEEAILFKIQCVCSGLLQLAPLAVGNICTIGTNFFTNGTIGN